MAVTTVGNASNIWGNISAVPSGHYAVYSPNGVNTLVLFSPTGQELARNVEALRAFALGTDPATGEIFALYTQFIDGSGNIPIRRWGTGVRVPVAPTAPPPTASGNAGIVQQIRDLLARIT